MGYFRVGHWLHYCLLFEALLHRRSVTLLLPHGAALSASIPSAIFYGTSENFPPDASAPVSVYSASPWGMLSNLLLTRQFCLLFACKGRSSTPIVRSLPPPFTLLREILHRRV